MDFKSKGRVWIGSIGEKFESFCSKVVDITCQKFEYVEHQMLKVSADVKQFCSELVEDAIPPFLVEREEDSDSDSEYSDDVMVMQNSTAGQKKNCLEANTSPSEVPEVVTLAEEDSNMASLSSRVHKSNDEEVLVEQVNLSGPHSSLQFEVYDACVNAVETSDLKHFKADISSAMPLPKSDILGEPSKFKFQDSGLTSSGNVLSVISGGVYAAEKDVLQMESSWSGFALYHESATPHSLVSLTDSAEEDRDDHVTKPGMETTQQVEKLKLKLHESCVLVDKNELPFVSEVEAEYLSCQEKTKKTFVPKLALANEQQRTCSSDPDAELRGWSCTPSLVNWDLWSDDDFCESDWEII